MRNQKFLLQPRPKVKRTQCDQLRINTSWCFERLYYCQGVSMCQSEVGGTRVCCGALERQRLSQALKWHFISSVSAGSISPQPGYSNCRTQKILRIGTGHSVLLHPAESIHATRARVKAHDPPGYASISTTLFGERGRAHRHENMMLQQRLLFVLCSFFGIVVKGKSPEMCPRCDALWAWWELAERTHASVI